MCFRLIPVMQQPVMQQPSRPLPQVQRSCLDLPTIPQWCCSGPVCQPYQKPSHIHFDHAETCTHAHEHAKNDMQVTSILSFPQALIIRTQTKLTRNILVRLPSIISLFTSHKCRAGLQGASERVQEKGLKYQLSVLSCSVSMISHKRKANSHSER